MSSNTVVAQLVSLREQRAAILAAASESLSLRELLEVLVEEERSARCAPAAIHPILNRLAAECSAQVFGGSSVADVLSQRLLIGKGAARQRLRDAEMLGRRRAMTGELLEPVWPATAAGQAAGEIGPEQLAVIRGFHRDLPVGVPVEKRVEAEQSLANVARSHLPREAQRAADLLLDCLNPDGNFSDEDRKRKRGITIGRQDGDGMSRISGYITPGLRAMIETVLAAWAAYGKNTADPGDQPPAASGDPSAQLSLDDALAAFVAAHAAADRDESPCSDSDFAATTGSEPDAGAEPPSAGGGDDGGTADGRASPASDGDPPVAAGDSPPADDGRPGSGEDVVRDPRTRPQRNHDAFEAVFRHALASHVLGANRGHPTTLVISVSLSQLLQGGGHALAATGSRIPMDDVIRMAKSSYPVLVVFDDHTGQPLYLGRTKRGATYWQWLALLARDGGCSRPGCTVGAIDCQIHHNNGNEWAAAQGLTDVDLMSLHCPPDHALLDKGYTAVTRADGRIEWRPPDYLDGGHARVNNYWKPENYLKEARQELSDNPG